MQTFLWLSKSAGFIALVLIYIQLMAFSKFVLLIKEQFGPTIINNLRSIAVAS